MISHRTGYSWFLYFEAKTHGELPMNDRKSVSRFSEWLVNVSCEMGTLVHYSSVGNERNESRRGLASEINVVNGSSNAHQTYT